MCTWARHPSCCLSSPAPPPAKNAAAWTRRRSAAQTEAGVRCSGANGSLGHRRRVGTVAGRAHRPMPAGDARVAWSWQRDRAITAHRPGAATTGTRQSKASASGAPFGSTLQARTSTQDSPKISSRGAGTTACSRKRDKLSKADVHRSQFTPGATNALPRYERVAGCSGIRIDMPGLTASQRRSRGVAYSNHGSERLTAREGRGAHRVCVFSQMRRRRVRRWPARRRLPPKAATPRPETQSAKAEAYSGLKVIEPRRHAPVKAPRTSVASLLEA